MTRYTVRILLFTFFSLSSSAIVAQGSDDSLTTAVKNQIFNKLKNLTFDFYIDVYYNMTLNDAGDTSNVVPFSGNCPIHDQIRLNVAALELYYNALKVRGKFVLQFGDAPNLLASSNAQWIKNIRQANFGFRIVKNFWVDFGYIFNPVGFESAWPVINRISFVTIGGYFEPGSVLGIKLSYAFSDKFSGGIMVGNPFSLAYAQNTHFAGITFLTYKPLPTLSFTYNNFFGNQALKNAGIENNILYNNIIVVCNPVRNLELVGQFDFAAQTNSHKPPDTTKIAGMFSGFLQARYLFNEHFSLSARYEFFNDPHGFLSGMDPVTDRGLRTNGFGISFEYNPVKIGYLRLAYRYLDSYPGSHEFYSGTSDNMQALIFTTGVRF